MEDLSNAFSVLDLDSEDNQVDAVSTSSSNAKPLSTNNTAKVSNGLMIGNEKQNEQNLVTSSSEYKMPLVWIDMVMTGLNIEVDRILEIACIITGGNLTKAVEGPDLVIHQSKECLEQMGEWCQSHHAASGLTDKALQSSVNEREAEGQVIEYVNRHIGTYKSHLNFLFLKKYMPVLASLFSHVIVDVSSVRPLCIRWYPRVLLGDYSLDNDLLFKINLLQHIRKMDNIKQSQLVPDQKKASVKESKHRAMDDIRESIKELQYYKENIFKVKSNK